VMFSHYAYYDELVDKLMGGDFTELNREAWVWMEDRFIAYPFQNNIRSLKPQTVFDCVNGVIQAQKVEHDPTNFREWMDAVFGAGITRHFMEPYNFKVWATPAELMNYVWIGERVSVVDVEAVLRNVILGQDQVPWGPNNTFRYPLRGGTGFLYEGLRRFVEDRLELETPVASVDPVAKEVRTADGRVWPYDVLLSTMPLNHLIATMDGVPDDVRRATDGLHWSGSHIVGVGVDRPAGSSKNWIYFPEPEVPFYRVTYLSNYSPYMTARPDQTLFLTETSRSPHKPEDESTIVQRVIDGLVATGLMTEADHALVGLRPGAEMLAVDGPQVAAADGGRPHGDHHLAGAGGRVVDVAHLHLPPAGQVGTSQRIPSPPAPSPRGIQTVSGSPLTTWFTNSTPCMVEWSMLPIS
jgi:protoporphyrinogen oxidase